ncbi:Ig-like domain-containing protein [Bacillus smithii]|uniref:Ig-like domain-containing protein n=1 Tax=Bacillus smithii TaxID=1479 RepID=UPI003D21776B
MAYQPKSYRKFVATAATATLVATAVTPAFAAENLPFKDVNQNYAKAVGELYSKGIVNGISKTEFGTYKTIKRGDAAVIIARALNLDTKNAPDAGFKDVNSKIKGAVNALVAKGIISGVSKDKFNPDATLTRGQTAKILVNAFNLSKYAKKTPFTDLTSTFKPYVEALYGAGVTSGKGTTYGTNENITRGDFVNLLYKAQNVNPAPVAESIKPIDDITVDEGTKLEDVKLPEKVTVVYSDKSEKEASVKWDTSKVDTSKPGTYKVEGTVDGTKLTASVNVVVKEVAKAESIKPIDDITVDEGTKLEDVKLPEKVTVVYSDKSEKEASVKWDTSKVDTSKPGTYKVEGTVDGTKLTASVNVVVKAVAPKVESVSAIGAKKLEVKFNKAVDDTKAKFEVKKAGITANISKVTFADDKKSAILELSTKLTKGEYTVNVTGLADQALSNSVTVDDEHVAKIEILSDTAVLDDNAQQPKATVAYKVENQYGEDITKTTSLQTNDNNKISLANGVATITLDTNAKVGDKVPLTLIDVDTATSASKVLTLSSAATVSDVAISGIYNKDGKTLNEDSDLSKDDFYLLVDVKDQYGNTITDPTKAAKGLIKSQSNPTVVGTAGTGNNVSFTSLKINGETKLGLKLTGPVKAGDNKVTLISTTSGKTATYDISVSETTRTDAVTLSQPSLAVAREDVLVPVSVFDKQGKAVTDTKILNDSTKGVAISLNGHDLPTPFVTQDNAVYVKIPKDKLETDGIYSLVAQSSTFKVSTLTLNVKKAAEPTVIRGLKSTVSSTLKAGTHKQIDVSDLVIEDQYGRVMDSAKVKAGLTGGKKIVVKDVDTNSNVVTFVGDITSSTTATLTAGSTNGTEKLQFVLNYGTKDILSSTAEVTFRVTDGSEYVSYQMDDIGTVYDEAGASKSDNNAYDKEIKVYGVLADGSKVQLDPKEYTVKSSLADLATDAADGVIDTANGSTPYSPTYPSNPAADVKEETLTVTINATGQEFTKTVTFSKVAPKATAVKVVDTDDVKDDALTSITYKPSADSDNTFSIADLTTGSSTGYNLVVTDQYGVSVVATPSTGAVTFPDKTAVADPTLTIVPVKGSIKITDNGLATATVDKTSVQAGEEFDVTINAGGSKTTVRVVAE